DVFGAEEFFRAVACDVFDFIDELAAPVVALARIALGVLVGQHAAGGLENGFGGEVFTRDQLDLAMLAVRLFLNEPVDVGIGFGQQSRHGISHIKGESEFYHSARAWLGYRGMMVSMRAAVAPQTARQ